MDYKWIGLEQKWIGSRKLDFLPTPNLTYYYVLCFWIKCWRNGKYNETLDKFESILGSNPKLEEVVVESKNVACCYSQLN